MEKSSNDVLNEAALNIAREFDRGVTAQLLRALVLAGQDQSAELKAARAEIERLKGDALQQDDLVRRLREQPEAWMYDDLMARYKAERTEAADRLECKGQGDD